MDDAEVLEFGLGLALYVALPALLLTVWWAIGRATERRHLRRLAEREAAVRAFPVTSLKMAAGAARDSGRPPALVCGEAVVASDGFKTWVFGLRHVVGGESRTFRRLHERARREAVLRMVEEAKARGFDAICNVRFDAVDIGGNTTRGRNAKPLNMAVCQVSGTAYVRGA